MNLLDEVAVFHISRGGRFKTLGELNFCGTDCDAKNRAESEWNLITNEKGRQCYVDDEGNFIGYHAEDGQEFTYEDEKEFDTMYGVKLKHLDYFERNAIVEGCWDQTTVRYLKQYYNISNRMWVILGRFGALKLFMKRGYKRLKDIGIRECTEGIDETYDQEVFGTYYRMDH